MSVRLCTIDVQEIRQNFMKLCRQEMVASDMKELDSLTARMISNEAIRRLLRHGGVVRCGAYSYHRIRSVLFVHLCQLIHDSFIYADHKYSLCITAFHIECAVKLQPGRRLYGFSDCALHVDQLDPNVHLYKVKFLEAKGYLSNPSKPFPRAGGWILALKEVLVRQREQQLMIRCQPFQKIVQQIGLGFAGNGIAAKSMVIEKMAITALQEKVEHYVVGLIQHALLQSLHAHRNLNA